MSAADDRADAYGQHLASAGGTARKADLRALAGLDANQAAAATRLLLDRGHATESDRRQALTLTPAGRARYTPPMPTAATIPGLDELLTGWPAGLAAAARLAALAILARPFTADAPRVGLALIGGTGTGKTSLGRFLAALTGHDPVTCKLSLPTVTDNPTVRRTRDADAPTGYAIHAAGWTTRPVVILDEWDKGTRNAQRDLFGSALAEAGRVEHEGQIVHIRAVPVLTANPPSDAAGRDRLRTLGDGKTWEAVARRCITLDTGRARDLNPGELAAVAAAAGVLHPGQRLPLDTFTMPTIPDQGTRAAVDELLRQALTEEALDTCPGAAALEPLARALHHLDPDTTPAETAAIAVITDYLTCAETIPGHIAAEAAGWTDTVREWASQPGTGPAAKRAARAAAAAAAARERHHAAASAAHARRDAEADTITRDAAAAAERCRLARSSLDGRRPAMRDATTEQKTQAAGLRKILRELGDTLARTRTRAGLDQATARAARHLDDAANLAAAIHRQHAAALDHRARQAQDKRDQAAAKRRAAAQQREHNRQARAAASAQLDQARAVARYWEAHYTRADGSTTPAPLATLTTPQGSNGGPLLTYTPNPQQPQPQGRWARLRDRLRDDDPGTWHTTHAGSWPAVSLPGSPFRCDALTTWGPATRAIITPFLLALHDAEDQLALAAHRKPRAKRPDIPRGAPAVPLPAAAAIPARVTRPALTRRTP